MLDEQLRERLKGITVVFMFLMFNSDKEEEIKADLSKLGISKVQFLYSNDMKQLGMRNAGLFADNKQRDIVKKFLGDVGYQLIKRAKTINGTYKEGWNDKRAHDASLGYNDAQQMFFLKSSVPTYTITAFWQDGVYNDIEWKPLFKRTIKD